MMLWCRIPVKIERNLILTNIQFINKEVYQNLLTSLSVGDNIENGHFAERIWAHLFRQYSFDVMKTERPERNITESDPPHPAFIETTDDSEPIDG